MASTFANVSKSSSTSYLFFFAARTFAHQNEPPTPPPLNALGLPCNAMCRLWARLYQKQKQANLDMAKESAAQAEVEEKDLKGAEARITSDKAQCKTGSWNFSTSSWSFSTVSLTAEKATQREEKLFKGGVVLEERAAADTAAEGTERSAKKEKTSAEMIEPRVLAESVTEYILDHQDDGAQEIVKRDLVMLFREQREEVQHTRAEVQHTRAEVQHAREITREEVQSMHQRFDDVHLKLEETIQLVRNLANPWPR